MCLSNYLIALCFVGVYKDVWSISPVVLVPGDGGSQLEAYLSKSTSVHYFCQKQSSYYFDLWLNLELLVPYVIDCLVDNMRLYYNNVTRTTSNTPGVTIHVPGFGNTTTIEYLDPSQIFLSKYLNSIVELLLEFKYVRGVHLHGAPFDFRKAPNEHSEFFDNLKMLIETTFEKNQNVRVTLISHSMGSAFTLFFLNQMKQSWKDKYIRAFVSLNGCLAGTVKALKVYVAGVYLLNAHSLKIQQISSPSLSFLMPSKKFWRSDEVLVANEFFNYTVNDYERFFKDVDYLVGWEMRKDTEHLIADLTAPGVEVHCLHGIGLPTINRLEYPAGTWLRKDPYISYGDGDGTVNLRSLAACLEWKKTQPQKVYYQTYHGVDHMTILHNELDSPTYSILLDPREGAHMIASQAHHVHIQDEGIAAIVREILRALNKNQFGMHSWKENDVHPIVASDQAAEWLFVVDALNFCFWNSGCKSYAVTWKNKQYTGYMALCAALNKASEIGKKLLEKYEGKFSVCVHSCMHSADALLKVLTSDFPPFCDTAIYEGYVGQGLGCFDDIDQLTMFADYRVPQVLLSFGALSYSTELLESLLSDQPLSPGCSEEIEIRGCSIHAVEKVVYKLKQLVSDPSHIINSIFVDFYLWDYRRKHQEELKKFPFHKVKSIFY